MANRLLAAVALASALFVPSHSRAEILDSFYVELGEGVSGVGHLYAWPNTPETLTRYDRRALYWAMNPGDGRHPLVIPGFTPRTHMGLQGPEAAIHQLPRGFRKVRMQVNVRSAAGFGLWGHHLAMVPTELRAIVGEVGGVLVTAGVVFNLPRGMAWNTGPFGGKSIVLRNNPLQRLLSAQGGLAAPMQNIYAAMVMRHADALELTGVDFSNGGSALITRTGRLASLYATGEYDIATRQPLFMFGQEDRHNDATDRVNMFLRHRAGRQIEAGNALIRPIPADHPDAPRRRGSQRGRIFRR